jgi:NADH:ubiquinone oxidoreductase subunit 6 (subunit J)
MEGFPQLTTWAQANVEQAVFYLLAVIAIPLAYGVVCDRNIIRSGFLLIGVFSTIAGLFILLSAQFLALAQIMIYGVGITLVVVIALMLTNPKAEKESMPALSIHKGPAIFVACFLFMCVYLALRSAENWPVKTDVAALSAAENLSRIGQSLLTNYSFHFEFASILLLAALIGAVMLAKAEPAVHDLNELSANEDKLKSSERADDVVKV